MTPERIDTIFADLQPYQRAIIRAVLCSDHILLNPPRYGKRYLAELMISRMRAAGYTIICDEFDFREDHS